MQVVKAEEAWDAEGAVSYAVNIVREETTGASEGNAEEVSETPVLSLDLPEAVTVGVGDTAVLTVEAGVTSGTLTYAWYQVGAGENGEDLLLTAADTATNQYVLPTESAAEASYYVAVTNTEDGKTPATVKSKMAAVSVLEKAAEPMIRSNLSADEVIYGKGDYAQWLSVGVKYQKGTKKTYQWYSNTSQTIEPGTTYYYVVVTNTREGILPISKTSSVAKITSASAKPVITTDLSTEQAAYKIGAQAQPLSVAAGSSDNGALTYQWYSSTTNSTVNGTAIEGATGSSYTPQTETGSTTYYYVVVSNTKDSYTTITTTSKAAQILVVAVPTFKTNSNYLTSGEVTLPKETIKTFGADLDKSKGGYGTLTYQWYKNTTDTKTTDSNITAIYHFHFIRKDTTAAEVEEMILALPKLEDLLYREHHAEVARVKGFYDKLSEEQKGEISEEAEQKLLSAAAKMEAEKTAGEAQLTELVDLIDTYAGKVTEENYAEYKEAVLRSKELYAQLSGWVYDTFTSAYKERCQSMKSAFDIINRAQIAGGTTVGTPTDYIDDFMVAANAFNLTLGADEKAYPVSFKDYIASVSGEACNPWNLPGRLKFTIADEEIFRIKTELSSYVDGGYNASGTYDNELYYLIPLKEGTTTLTVTLTDETGTYYGQLPEMIVHVNSAQEAAIENLADKLTNINSLSYTTKYDTWYYWEGTAGAPFTFKVNGTDAKVYVWDYLGNGTKTEYPVAADGSVTVLLKDGYNPIEVSAVYEGKQVTQVYGMKGKVISYKITNDSRPGKALKQGDNVTITLTNGHMFERWWGSPLYSETAQGNTGEIAPQTTNYFSPIPDISFEVEADPNYAVTTKVTPVIEGGNTVRPGQSVTLTMDDLDLTWITDTYPQDPTDTYKCLLSAQSVFAADIPGLSVIKSLAYNMYAQGNVNPLSIIKTITFTVPEDTPDGTYTLRGGYVNVMYGNISFGTYPDYMLKKMINDVQITVQHECTWDAGTISKKAGCISEGEKIFKCTVEGCIKTKTETIPAAGHSAGDWTVTKAATCAATGRKVQKCSTCQAVLKAETIAKTGAHKYGSWTTVSKATVFAAKVKKHTCSLCGASETKNVGKALTPVLEVPGKLSSFNIKKGETVKFALTLAKGDSISSVKSSASKYVKVAAVDQKSGKISLEAVKKGTAKITIKLASGKTKNIR